MADKNIKEQMTPLELQIAEGFGVTPEELFVSAKLGVRPDQILEQQNWHKKQKQIDAEAKRSKTFGALREIRARNSVIKLSDCEEER